MKQVAYAKVFGPPENWRELRIFDATFGYEIKGVIEADAEQGWYDRYAEDKNGKLISVQGEVVIERIHRRIRIEAPECQ